MSNRAYIEPVPEHKIETLAEGVSMGADFFSEVFDARNFYAGAIQLYWTGADAVDAVAVLQGSVNGISFNDLGNTPTDETIDVPQDSALFEIKICTVDFYRVRFQANSNTAGTMTIKARGRGYI